MKTKLLFKQIIALVVATTFGIYSSFAQTFGSGPLGNTICNPLAGAAGNCTNTYVGSGAGLANTTGVSNTFVGNNAGLLVNGADHNSFYGANAGSATTNQGANTFVGSNAGLSNTAIQNTFVGTSSGQSNITGTNNNCFGVGAGFSNTTGIRNVYFGDSAGSQITDASENTIVGYLSAGSTSGQSNYGSFNTTTGYQALRSIITGWGNVAIGHTAAFTTQTGDRNVAVGKAALYLNNSGSKNTIVGDSAGFAHLTDSCVFVGYETGLRNTTGTHNTFVGTVSGCANITTRDNSFFGFRSGFNNVIDSNTFVGSYCGWNNTSGIHNTFMGTVAGYNNSTGRELVCVGFKAGFANLGDSNVFVGSHSGVSNTNGEKNTFVGFNSGFLNATGDDNTYVGSRAGATAVAANDNAFFGFQAGVLATVGQNTYIGSKAGNGSSHTGKGNVLVGYAAGSAGSFTGDTSVFVGLRAGEINTSGKFNTSIGAQSGPLTAFSNLNNSTAIGHASAVDCDNCLVLGNGGPSFNYHVAIGLTGTSANFHVGDMNGSTGSNDIRFEDLPNDDDLDVLTWNNVTGRVYWGDADAFAHNGCTTNGFVPFYSTGSGQYECSIIRQKATTGCTANVTGIGIDVDPGCILMGEAIDGLGGSLPAVGDAIKLDVLGNVRGNAFISYSDRRLKDNIKTIENALDKVKKLEGVSYTLKATNDYKMEGSSLLTGYIAQDLQKSIPEVVGIDDKGYYGINYSGIIPYLSEAIKEQQKQLDANTEAIKEQQKQLNAKDETIAQLKNTLKDFENSLSECCMNYQSSNDNVKNIGYVKDESARLEQNNPNPFTENTSIQFYIPSNSGKAILKIYSLAGVELKSFIVNEKGTGQISFSGKTFAAGSYVYTLILDGRQVDSKYMTLTK